MIVEDQSEERLKLLEDIKTKEDLLKHAERELKKMASTRQQILKLLHEKDENIAAEVEEKIPEFEKMSEDTNTGKKGKKNLFKKDKTKLNTAPTLNNENVHKKNGDERICT